MIVATAGHVDHGKTTLVRALTGIDTDRLTEEQRRGMTIDLGFAHADLAESGEPPAVVGFVDVPGHERFVRTMLAGVAAVDLALLVVAADDGPMPQTTEHLAVLQALQVPRLVVALTKADRVPPERLATATQAVQALLAGGCFAGAPVFALATPAGTGLPALRRHLAAAARTVPPRAADGSFRLAIDRSFQIAGAGRVVAGTVLAGRVQVDDMVWLSPAGVALRVRGVQIHGQAAQAAQAGQRCALNLAGPELKRVEPARGDWLLAPGRHAPSTQLDLRLALAAEAAPAAPQPAPGADPHPASIPASIPAPSANPHAAPHPSPHPSPHLLARLGRTALQLHIGAAVRNARLRLLQADPGGPLLARITLDAPVAAAWGDRVLLRDLAAQRVLAGAMVLDALGPARGAARPARLAQLRALDAPDAATALARLLADAPCGVDLAWFGLSFQPSDKVLDTVARQPGAVLLPGSQRLIHRAHWQAWQARLLQALAEAHAREPQRLGPELPALRTLLGEAAAGPEAQPVWRAALAELVAQGAVQRQGLAHHLPGHQVQPDPQDAALFTRLAPLLQAGGLRPPIVGELSTLLPLPLELLRPALGRLARQGLLVQVAPNRWFLPDTVAALAAQARALAEDGGGSFDAAGYRDRTGIGRNLTVQVLEFFDRSGLTRFDGLRHRWLG